jgi:hypothetical protein
MAVTKRPWLEPWMTEADAQAIATQVVRKRRRRDCVITAWVEDAYVGELRKHPRRSRKAGAMFIDDPSLADFHIVYRVVVEQRLKHGGSYRPWSERQRQPGG